MLLVMIMLRWVYTNIKGSAPKVGTLEGLKNVSCYLVDRYSRDEITCLTL